MARKDLKQLESLGRLASGHKSEMSPNDVLVQIMLPLVLILAVSTRLMLVGQNLVTQSQVGPSVMELWKQQLILKIDQRLDRWERESEFSTFPDFERVYWQNGWPMDDRFKKLCASAAVLEDADDFAHSVYMAAIQEGGPAAGKVSESVLGRIYDPLVNQIGDSEGKAGFVMDDARRGFALDRIRQRRLVWREHILDLQWKLIARLASEQPIDSELSASDPATQMRMFSEALAKRGYVLMPEIMREFGSK